MHIVHWLPLQVAGARQLLDISNLMKFMQFFLFAKCTSVDVDVDVGVSNDAAKCKAMHQTGGTCFISMFVCVCVCVSI